jgi:FtsP/CotA-like multicopper oxidase with cupredoxin domain
MARRTIIIVAAILIAIAAFNAAYLQSLPTTRRMEVQAYDFFFTATGLSGNNPTITVRTGDTVVLTLENMGTKNNHEFFVLTQSDFKNYTTSLQVGENATEPLPAFTDGSVEDVPPGESKTGTFVVGQPGTYVYACLDTEGTDPLTHANKGMYGTFIVESGGLFSITRSMGDLITNMFGTALVNIPSIVIWQAAIVLALAALLKREQK